MERNHIHLCQQIGGTWIRRKKRANIVVYIDVQEARKAGLEFYSAPNYVIMCPGDRNGYIPVKYFKEVKNIHTGEQIDFKTNNISAVTQMDNRLYPLVQYYTPTHVTGMTTV